MMASSVLIILQRLSEQERSDCHASEGIEVVETVASLLFWTYSTDF